MTNWKYKLDPYGQVLRELINKEGGETIENIISIYNQIIKCLEYWKKRLSDADKEDWEYDIETMIEDLQCACPDIEDNLDYEEEEENLNYYLRDFYDMCDNARVWIGV